MTALVGFPTLRLVRTGIDILKLGGLALGEARELTLRERDELFRSLRLTHRGG
jgi:16S rRNA U516 pseudouridylate synthase RsuA-like enzyme